MKTFITLLLSLALSTLSLKAQANFGITQLDPTVTDPVFRVLAATIAFTPVQPASSATLFGFSLGVTGISAQANQSSAIVNGGAQNLYDGDISASVQVPLGLAVELGYLPSLSISGATLGRFGGDVKWTFTDLLTSLPLNGAVRGFVTHGTLSDTEPLNGGTVNISYSTNITGGNISFSKKFLIIEPYISYGLLQQSSTLSSSGSANLFNGNFPSGTTSISSQTSTGWFQLGAQLKLALITFAAEYDNLFQNDNFAGRVAFSF